MSALITSDIHLTDNERDADRWHLFPWITKQVQKLGINVVLVLGDITDMKDKHSAPLVNRFVDQVYELSQVADRVVFMKGNHDYIDEANPFFGFLQNFDNVTFVSEPKSMKLPMHSGADSQRCLFLPSSKNAAEEWAQLDLKGYDYIFTHQTFDGCVVENGSQLSGLLPSIFKGCGAKVYSGDIHVPQVVGKYVEYVGAPYRCHFGDTFEPRLVHINGRGVPKDIRFPSQGKYLATIRNFDDLRALPGKFIYLTAGDQLKVRVRLKRSEMPEWPKLKQQIKEYCDQQRWVLFGPELAPLESSERQAEEIETFKRVPASVIIKQYGKSNKLTQELVDVGLSVFSKLGERKK